MGDPYMEPAMIQYLLILLPTSMLGLLAIGLVCWPRSAVASESVTRTTTQAAYATAGVPVLAGFSADEWTAIGVAGGLVLGLLTWIGNMVVNWHFKSQHLKLARERAGAGLPVSDED